MKEGLLIKCNQIITDLHTLKDLAFDDFEKYDPEDLWSYLYKIVDKIENLQQGAKLPVEIGMDITLPSDEDEEESNSCIIWFKTDIQHVERGIEKIVDWIENYYEEEREIEKEDEKRTHEEKKNEKTLKVEENISEIKKEKIEERAKLSLGPVSIPISKEQAKFILVGFVLGIIFTILTVVLPIVLS